MITVAQARRLVEKETRALKPVKLPLVQAHGLVLAKAVASRSDSPRFDNSAMDGFAVKTADLAKAGPGSPVELKLAGTLAAGTRRRLTVKKGETLRIMTGAPLPPGADAVVARELVEEKGKRVSFTNPVRKGNHIRRRAEELRKGTPLLKSGERLHSRNLALLAACGVGEVLAYPRPRVAVFSTGSELVEPGSPAAGAQIFDSNGPMLQAQVAECGARLARRGRLADTRARIEKALGAALAQADVLLVAGGVSVGDYDYVKDAFKALGVRQVFWKVSQKPGKPLFFGVRGAKLVFGLPGNPAAAWTCFDEYVRPALRAMVGRRAAAGWHPVRAAQDLDNPGGRDLFAKARLGRGGLVLLEGQGSHMLRSLAQANVLAYLPAGSRVKKGRTVAVRRLKG